MLLRAEFFLAIFRMSMPFLNPLFVFVCPGVLSNILLAKFSFSQEGVCASNERQMDSRLAMALKSRSHARKRVRVRV